MPRPPSAAATGLARLMHEHFEAERALALLDRELPRLRQSAQDARRAAADEQLAPSQGVAQYEANAGRGRGTPGDPTAAVLRAWHRNLRAAEAEAQRAEGALARAEADRDELLHLTAPVALAMSRLHGDCARVLTLRFRDGKMVGDIAGALRIPDNEVRGMLRGLAAGFPDMVEHWREAALRSLWLAPLLEGEG